MTPTGPSGISPLRLSNTYPLNMDREAVAQPAPARNQYDSVTLSGAGAGRSRFHMELVSRLSHEVRTATTTGDIQALRQAVAAGEYAPDPMAIARRMLFLTEDA